MGELDLSVFLFLGPRGVPGGGPVDAIEDALEGALCGTNGADVDGCAGSIVEVEA